MISSLSVTPAAGPGGTRFRAAVTTTDAPPVRLNYQWRLDGRDLTGATGASHVATSAGQLSVLATAANAEGAQSRESTAVTVAPGLSLPEILNTAIAPAAGGIGDRFTVTLAAAGVPGPALAYQWLLDGAEICGATGPSHVARAAGRLSVRVVARNTEGSDSREAEAVEIAVPATPPVVTSALVQPASGRAGVTSFTAVVEAAGTPAPVLSHQWFIDGAPVPGATEVNHVPLTKGALKVRITASNPGGEHSRYSEDAVIMPGVAPPRVRAVEILPNAGRVGDSFVVTTTTCGYPAPELKYEWFYNGHRLDQSDGDSYTATVAGTVHVRVTATNPEGEDTRESGAVPIEPALAPPVIAELAATPAAGWVGDRFEAAAIVAGHPEPEIRYQWYRGDRLIIGADEAAYRPDSPGHIHVEVTAVNALGRDNRSSAPVDVAPALAAPVIETATISPAAGRVGDAFRVTATAIGVPAPVVSYQWLRDGVPIEGATAAYHLAERPGRLAVQVTAMSVAGMDLRVSDPVAVEPALAAPQIVTIGVTPETGRVGDVFALLTSVSGYPEPEIGRQWLLDGEEIAGATGEWFVATTAGRLSARVVAENVAGVASRDSRVSTVTADEMPSVFETNVFEEGVYL